MPDPYAIFRGAPEKHRILEIGWPDLYAALKSATAAPAAGVARLRPCEMLSEHGAGERPPAVGRISPRGPAACRSCLTRLRPAAPDGWPLDIHDARNAR